ncbi:ABC transporter substrate-binding protein [bacterium]|nr:ABC transporter substrate-binding protein [bacterium]
MKPVVRSTSNQYLLIFKVRLSALTFGILVILIASLAFADSSKKIKLGIILPLSGTYADNGEDCKRGVEIARTNLAAKDKLGSYAVEHIYEDSKNDPKISLSIFNQLVEQQKAQAVFTIRSTVGMALNPLSKRMQVPLFGVIGHTDFPFQNPYAFQVMTTGDEYGPAIVKLINSRGLKRIATITTEDDWLISITDGIRAEIKKSGLSLVVDEPLMPTEMEFFSHVSRIRKSNADAILLNLAINQIVPFIKRLREQGLTQPIFSNYWVGKPEVMASAAAELFEGVEFPEVQLQLPGFNKILHDKYEDVWATQITFSCYVSMKLFYQALQTSNKITDRNTLYKALLGITSIEMPDQDLTVKDRHVKFSLARKRIEQGKVVEYELIK